MERNNSDNRKNQESDNREISEHGTESMVVGGLALVGVIYLVKEVWNFFRKEPEISTIQGDPDRRTQQKRVVNIPKPVTYDEDFLGFLDEQQISNDFICPISQIFMQHPYLISTCGHSFEHIQISEWLNKQSTCPVCKQAATTDDLVLNYSLKNLLESEGKKLREKFQSTVLH